METRGWVDGFSTSVDWEKLACPLAVLPLGSFEQHGPHLPVMTDTLHAGYFAGVVARELGGALLPTLPFCQCFEHSGLRGSVGFRPETAMALIRDIADSLERQHFKRLVIVNGHGGNQSIGPVVRDLNRQDRPLKILLMNWYEFDTSPEGAALRQTSLHADGRETSVALALFPERVGDYQAQLPEGKAWPVVQADLNHFGMGTLRPQGYWGDPRQASAEIGRAMVKSVEENLVNAIRERLGWLEAEPAYGGAGRVIVRQQERWDLEDGLRLAQASGWNQRLADWELIRALSPRGAFTACRNGGLVGTLATVNYADRVSWIAMVLVDPALRRRGIATQLMEAGLAHLAACETVKLDATPAGRSVYLKLGFADEYELNRLAIASVPAVPKPEKRVRPMTEADLPAVTALDARIFGVPRGDLLPRLRNMAPEYAWVAEGPDGLKGFSMGRHGAHWEYAGPVSATDEETAWALLQAFLSGLRGRGVIVDVPAEQAAWQIRLKALGFAEQRILTRMVKGSNRFPGRLESVFAIAGPEFG